MAASGEGDAWILKEVSPSFLFFFGLALAPSLWLQAHLAWKAAQALLFFALAAWARPRGWWRAGLASLIFSVGYRGGEPGRSAGQGALAGWAPGGSPRGRWKGAWPRV